MSSRIAYRAVVMAMLASSSMACFKKEVALRVHAARPVAIDAWSRNGTPVSLFAPEDSQRSLGLTLEGSFKQAIVARQVGSITISWPGTSLDVVDASGMLPWTWLHDGFEIREGRLFARYELTETAILPPSDRIGAMPIVIHTPLDNIAEASEVREWRRWPAYIFFPLAGLFALGGATLLLTGDPQLQIGSAPFFGAAAGCFVGGYVFATKSPQFFLLQLPAR